MKFLIDSSAWIEYLDGSEEGEKVYEILKGNHEIYTLSLIIAEVVSKSKRSDKDANISFKAIMNNSRIFEITSEIAKESGYFHAEMKRKQKGFGLVDAFIWICAQKLKAKLITRDNHFKKFENLILLR